MYPGVPSLDILGNVIPFIKSEEEKRQEVEQQMQAMQGAPQTPIEQVTELGESVMEKLIAAGITTVEQLADMTAEELGEVPGIGERSVERIAISVRHYFGQYEEGEARPTDAPAPEPVLEAGEEAVAAAPASDHAGNEVHSMTKTPEEILATQAKQRRSATSRPKTSLLRKMHFHALTPTTPLMPAKKVSRWTTIPSTHSWMTLRSSLMRGSIQTGTNGDSATSHSDLCVLPVKSSSSAHPVLRSRQPQRAWSGGAGKFSI